MALIENTLPLAIHSISGIVGLLSNGSLLFLVLNRTPDSFKVYSILIINTAICEFVACLMAIFVQQRVIPLARVIIFLSGGPCKFIGWEACFIGHCITLHCYSHGMWSLMLSFLFRYVVLKHRFPTATQVLILLLLFYSLSFMQMVLNYLGRGDPDILRQDLYNSYPQYDISNEAISGDTNIFDWKTMFVIIHITCAVFPIYGVIIWCRYQILLTLENHTSMSNKTKSLHSQLVKALTYQAILPAVFSLASISFLLGLFGLFSHPMLEYSVFILLGFVPVLSPLGTLFFIRPYHDWIAQKFKLSCSGIPKEFRSHSISGNNGVLPST